MKSVASYCLSSSSSFYVLFPCLHGLDGFHTRDSSTWLVSRVCIEADVLWPDALPDANPTYSSGEIGMTSLVFIISRRISAAYAVILMAAPLADYICSLLDHIQRH